MEDWSQLNQTPLKRAEISDPDTYNQLLALEHMPRGPKAKRLANALYFGLMDKLDRELELYREQMRSDQTPCEGVDINGKPYSF